MAIDCALTEEDSERTAPLLAEYVDAPEHANVAVMVSCLLARLTSSKLGGNQMELEGSMLPPL